jgi:hypothetical protein
MTPEDEARIEQAKLLAQTAKCLQGWVKVLDSPTFGGISGPQLAAIEALCRIYDAV